MTRLIIFGISGLVLGSLYSALGVGVVTVFKCTKIPNFAQAAFGLVAAYVTWTLTTGRHHVPFVLAAVVGLTAAAATGYAADRFAMRFLLGQPIISLVIFTFGLNNFLTDGVQLIWGPELQSLPLPLSSRSITFAGLSVSYVEILIVAIVLIAVIMLAWFFSETRLGLASRAVAQHRTWPNFIGVNVAGVMSFSWALTGILGGLAGIFLSGFYYLSPDLPVSFLLPAFTGAAIGGFASIWGAYLGGILVGLAQDLVSGYIGVSWSAYSAFVLLFVVLMVRPAGLFGSAEESRV